MTSGIPISIAVSELDSSIMAAIKADKTQGQKQAQATFLAKLQELARTLSELKEMVVSVEAHLMPKPNWKSSLELADVGKIVEDFRDRLARQDFNTFGVYDNFSQFLERFLQSAKNMCNEAWIPHRDSMFVGVRLDFEYPNDKVLRAIAPGLRIPPSFTFSKRLLEKWSSISFEQVWDDECDQTSSGFAEVLGNNQQRIKDYKNAITPVATALAGIATEVANFLRDASTGIATLAQAMDPRVAKWLADSNLSESFTLRFKDSD